MLDLRLHISHKLGEYFLSWKTSVKTITVKYAGPILQTLPLQDGTGLIVVFGVSSEGISGAQILNLNGTIRCHIQNPMINSAERFEINYVEYINNRIHVVYASQVRDFGVYIDDKSCQLSDVHESR